MAKKNAKPKNNKRSTLIAVAITAGVLTVVALCLWISRPGPLDKVRSAGEKTFFADNFTAQFTLNVNGEEVNGIINAAIDPDEKLLQMYMRLTTYETEYDGGIYNNTFVICKTTADKITSVDITPQVDNFFALLEENGQPDWSALLEISDVNLYEAISKDFDFDTLLSCLGQWLDCLNDTDWAEENAAYRKEKIDGITTYQFSPNPYTLACQTAPMFETAFRDPQRYEALLGYIDNAKYLFKDGKVDFSFGVKDGYLVSADFALQYYKTDISGSCSFIGIGSTIVDINIVASYIAAAN